ncbi:MAG: BatA domain-containing protein [Planctomycetes bacterium]|nr:BatA domain-containing protein [Planctomycetota bacterium]
MGGWIGGFAHPALLWGLGLASVPILIHLLNRQRHKPMPWAAMRFVLAAYRKTRRRVQLENLLLLLLRTAAVALLALAVTRPFTGDKSPLATLTEGRRDLVVIVDGSASMGLREGVESVFERSVKRAREIVRKLSGSRGDRVRLIYAGQYPRLLSWTTPEQASSMLDTLTAPTDEPLDLAAALADVLQRAKEGPSESTADGGGVLEVLLLTDLQARVFHPEDSNTKSPETSARGALFDVLERLREHKVTVVVEAPPGSEPNPPNLGIAAVEPMARLGGPGQPAEIVVEVRNFGPATKNNVRIVLEVDGDRRPSETTDVPARGRSQVVFSVAFKTAGEHVLTARIEDGDRLACDNQRSRVVVVPPAVRVLLVNGAPGAIIEEDEIGYLRAVIEPASDAIGRGSLAPFDARELAPGELSAPDVDFTHYDVIWLANVESLPAIVVDKLEAAVAGGRALIVSLGDRVDTAAANTRLFRADGSGLLPASLGERVAVRSRSEAYYRVKSFDTTHPALSFFADERFKPLLTEIPVYEFISARPIAGARVLATLDDDGGSPLLVERAYDRGRVFLWTTTIDPLWTRLPESPATLVPLVHEWLHYAGATPEPPRNVAPGTPLVAETSHFPRNVTVVRPDGARRPLDGDSQSTSGDRWVLPAVPGKDTETAGVYRIEMDGGAPISFAVNVDPREGDLERITPTELTAMHFRLSTDDAPSGDPGTADRRGELWRWIAILCLVALVCESLWAAFLGRKRSVRR